MVQAYDMGTPQRTSQMAEVYVAVGRNKRTPTFSENSYTAALREDQNVGEVIASLRATDEDERV